MIVLAVPFGIAAVSMSLLWERYDDFASYFFSELNFQEQAALLALLFAFLFAAIGVSQAMDENRNKNANANNNILDAQDAIVTSASSTSLHSHTSHTNQSITASVTSSTSKNNNISYPLHEMNQALSDRSKFSSLYPWLRDSILESLQSDATFLQKDHTTVDYISRMMDYTITGGRFHRGTTVVAVYRAFLLGTRNKVSLSSLEVAQACTLGWTIEFLQAFFLVADDVMDESIERRGQPCWYQVSEVQLKAVNDAFLLESFVYLIIKKHFGHLPCYVSLLELMLEVIQKTQLGQLMDLRMPKQDEEVDFSRFTVNHYQSIVRYKTAYYSFYLPVALAIALAGIEDPTTFQLSKDICCIMGEYFQVQADLIDCYGDPRWWQSSTDGAAAAPAANTGTDIRNNKCTWLIVQALHKCNPVQRQTLLGNYGLDDDESVQKVKNVYLELQLMQAFQAYQAESYAQIQNLLGKMQTVPKDVYNVLLKKVYRRMGNSGK